MTANKICVCFLMTLIGANLSLADKENPSAPADSSIKEQPSDDSGNNENAQRLLSTRLVSCDYASQPGLSCVNCRQALQCFSSNLGLRISCRGSRQYCNNGRCSSIRGPACSTTTSPTSTPTQTTASASSVTTPSGPTPSTSPSATPSGSSPATTSGSSSTSPSGAPTATPSGSSPATTSGSSSASTSSSSAATPSGN